MSTKTRLRISAGQRSEAPVITVHGEIDMITAPSLHERLFDLACARTPVVIVDLSGVSFIDSTGLGALVVANKRFDDDGASLRLVLTHPGVQKVFEVTDMNEIFSVYPNVEEAVEGATSGTNQPRSTEIRPLTLTA